MKKLVFISILLIAYSCTKTIDIDLPEHESKLVINSLFTRGERIAVNISQSTSILGGTPPGIFGATVNLYRDGTLVETAVSGDSIYLASFGPVENGTYTVEVSAPEFETVVATDSMPSKTEINYALSTDEVWFNDIGTKLKLIKLGFSDTDTNPNFFELTLNVRYLDPYVLPPDQSYIAELACIGGIIDPVLEEAELYYSQVNGLVFDDKLFENGECDLEIFAGILNNDSDEYELIIELKSISENYYNYKKQLGVYLNKEDGDIFEGIPDPVNLFSNINFGYGIFAGYMSDESVLNISTK